MTKILDLPVNLVEEILSKVPLKYMRAVRSTCKEWNTLSKSQSFSKMHIDKISADESSSMMVAALMGQNLYLMNVVLVVKENPVIERIGKLPCKISEVFHCDGLLLCVLKDNYTKVIVWNPYWGQTSWIECRYSHRLKGRDEFCYALGYEDKGSSCRNYKFLRFIDQCVGYEVEDQFLRYEIYDFKSSSWKDLDVNTPHWHIFYYQRSVSLKGNTYWPASKRREDAFENHIICFDFTSESFGPLLRLPFKVDHYHDVTLSCVREEKLAVLFERKVPRRSEIWITTKIEAEKVSWSKFFTVVDTKFEYLITSDYFFIDEEKKVAMSFEKARSKTFNIVGEDGYFKKLQLTKCLGRDIDWINYACSYAPSLAKIKQPGGKQIDQLERQRYDKKNMVRSRVWLQSARRRRQRKKQRHA